MALNQKQAKELREKLFEQMKFDGFTVIRWVKMIPDNETPLLH